jgi:hypothetical protein
VTTAQARGGGKRMAVVGVAVLEAPDPCAIASWMRGRGSMAPMGHSPRRGPWRSVTMSGAMPSCSQAKKVPVRPMPHMTSSRIRSTPCRSQISRMRLK